MSAASSVHTLGQSDDSRLDPSSGGGNLGLYSLSFSWECPGTSRGVSPGWCHAVSLWHLLRKSSCLWLQPSWVTARFGPQAELNTFRLHVIVLVLPSGELSQLEKGPRGRTPSRVCLFPCLLAWALLGQFLCHQHLPPECLSHQHSSLSSGITCEHILLLRLDSSLFILSQVPITIQIPLVGNFGGEWEAVAADELLLLQWERILQWF